MLTALAILTADAAVFFLVVRYIRRQRKQARVRRAMVAAIRKEVA
jgi:preprotein translocase subunit YajC